MWPTHLYQFIFSPYFLLVCLKKKKKKLYWKLLISISSYSGCKGTLRDHPSPCMARGGEEDEQDSFHRQGLFSFLDENFSSCVLFICENHVISLLISLLFVAGHNLDENSLRVSLRSCTIIDWSCILGRSVLSLYLSSWGRDVNHNCPGLEGGECMKVFDVSLNGFILSEIK